MALDDCPLVADCVVCMLAPWRSQDLPEKSMPCILMCRMLHCIRDAAIPMLPTQ